MALIKSYNTSPDKENLLIIVSEVLKGKNLSLSEEEIKHINAQIKAGKKTIQINTIKRLIVTAVINESKPEHIYHEKLRKLGNQTGILLNELGKDSVVICSETGKGNDVVFVAEGMSLGNYQFVHYKSKSSQKLNSLKEIKIYGKPNEKLINEINNLVDAVSKARNLVNEPANKLNPTDLANAFRKMGKEAGFSVEVYNKAKIESLKMGGLLAVNKGSVDPPTFSIMEYKPKSSKNKKPIILVGKGITYDTGGLSLKPTPNSMDMMKCDMAGAAVVGATMYAIAKAKLNIHVIGLVPSTDNRPGFNAFAPGDIITMFDGTTVEMLNSDAEGRMILGDALAFAKKYKPQLAIELSTLTGAAANAIGYQGIVSMGNLDKKTNDAIKEAGNSCFERLAEFPFWEEYDELIKSDIADVKNLGGPQAGAITAGRFLLKFTDYPYLHLDIAGPAFITARNGYQTKGGTGVGVRLLFNYLKNL